MTRASLEVFDNSLLKVDLWLRDLMREMDWDNPKDAYTAYRAVLHALRDRLMPTEALHLASQMPTLIRGFFLEGWNPSRTPEKIRNKNEFLEYVIYKAREATWLSDVEDVVRAVFQVLCQHITLGEIINVVSILPRELKELWPEGIQDKVEKINELNRRGQEKGSSKARGPWEEVGPLHQILPADEIRGWTGPEEETSKRIRVKTYWGVGPRNYVRPDDSIMEEIFENLKWNPEVDASDIEVEVKNGHVTLKGKVADRQAKFMVEDLIGEIRGVKEVRNELKYYSLREWNQMGPVSGLKVKQA